MKKAFAAAAFVLISFAAYAADYPAPKQAEWIARDFKFHTGEVMPELRIGYTTVGEPTGQPVLVLHGTTGSANSHADANFAGELFGAGRSRSTPRNTSSSSRTRSATANPPSRPTG